jgi:hypothetical protein
MTRLGRFIASARHSIEAFDQRGDSQAQDHFNSGS